MRLWLILFPALLSAQSCSHQLTRTPIGPVLVYRNGLLQRQGLDYSSVNAPGTNFPILTPLQFGDQDLMSAVITRAVPLSFTIPGPPPQTITYFSYALWREDWTCTGNGGEPSGVIVFGGFTSGGFGFGVTNSAGPVTILLMPAITGDTTGMFLQDTGVTSCPIPMDTRITALHPVCHQAAWVAGTPIVGTVTGAGVGALLGLTLQATPCTNSSGCAGIRTVQARDGLLYYLIDQTGPQL